MTEEQLTTKQKNKLEAIVITFTVIVLAIFFGVQLIMKTGVFHEPGQLIFADSMTEANQDFVNNNLEDINHLNLAENVTINALESTTSLTNLSSSTTKDDVTTETRFILYDILLPVTTFDDPTLTITPAAAKSGNLISVWNLTPEHKLLALSENSENILDAKYYLDDLTNGAFFQYLEISGTDIHDVDKITDQLRPKVATFPTKDTLLTLAQTGVTALSRRMNTKLNQIGDATYFAEKIAPFLSSFDFTHTSNESSFSNFANGSNICSAPIMIDALTAIGLDIVELTGNHNQDCGDADAIATIEQYHNLGMQTFGGGVSATAAAIPLTIDAKDANITMLGYNLSTGGYTLDETPGANFYTEEKARQDIADAKARGDFVIIDVQYYECNEYVDINENTTCDAATSSAGDQVGLFRSLIDMGADIVVGTAAHQPQTFEQYHGGTIYYGLGNLFFDQSAWPGTTRSLILIHYFWQGNLIQTRIVPTVYDGNLQTELMSTINAEKFLARLLNARPAPTED